MKKTLLIIIINLQFFYSFSQEKKNLVVGIVVDQMRYDYVYRFWGNFNNNGFKTLVNEGYFFRNTQLLNSELFSSINELISINPIFLAEDVTK